MKHINTDIVKKPNNLKHRFINTYRFFQFILQINTNNVKINKIFSLRFLPLKLNTNVNYTPDINISLSRVDWSAQIHDRSKKIRHKFNDTLCSSKFYKKNNEIFIYDNGSYATGIPQKGVFSIFLNKLDSSKPLFMGVLISFLKFRGLFAIHSALIYKNKSGILLVGRSGSGKTTLAQKLIKKNFSYVCDDVCLLQYRNRKKIDVLGLINMARGMDNLVSKKKDWIAGFPEFQKKSYSPKFIVFLKITNKNNAVLNPISRNEAIKKLLRSSQLVWLEEKSMMIKHVGLLKDLLDQCQCFEFLANKNVRVSADVLSKSLLNLINQ